MFMFGPYRTISRVGVFGVLTHSIYTFVKHFVFIFEFYEKVSFLLSLEVLLRSIDPYL